MSWPNDATLQDPLKPLGEVHELDERCANLGISLESLHAELSRLQLSVNVPVGIRQSFETAKNLCLYSAFVYQFQMAAEMVAYSSLEWALRAHWSAVEDKPKKKVRGLRDLLEIARARQWLRNSGFSTLREKARRQLLVERSTAMIENGEVTAAPVEIPEPTVDEVEERALAFDFVAAFVENIPDFRNNLAHGSQMLRPYSLVILRDVADAINQLFPEAGNAEGGVA